LLGGAGSHREQMQVMVAEYALGTLTGPLRSAIPQRLRPAIDKVAGEPQPVTVSIETDFCSNFIRAA
jgi:hypothetical protein